MTENHMYRLFSVATAVGRRVLFTIFQWGCCKADTIPLSKFLVEEKSMTLTEFKRRFNRVQRETILADPKGETYDITLLYICIQLGCSGLKAPEDDAWITCDDFQLEYLLYSIKSFRNEVVHHVEENITQRKMFSKIEEIRNIYTKSLKLAGSKYNRQQHEIDKLVKDINDSINKTRDTSVSKMDFRQYSQEIMALRTYLENLVNTSGKEELKVQCDMESQVNPISFISEGESLDISAVFTKMEMVNGSRQNYNEEPNNENIFELTDSIGNKPPLVLVEGIAGAGKTTLCKLIMHDWSKGIGLVHELDQFDLLLYMKCRDPYYTNFSSFLLSCLPDTSNCLKNEDLIRSVLNSKVLILVDGLDEINKFSQKLFNELLHKHFNGNAGNLRIMCTTRPESVHAFYKMVPTGVQTCHLKLAGISKDRVIEFVTKIYHGIRGPGSSDHDIAGLINFLMTSSTHTEHFRFPLNLVFLTYLWSEYPDSVKWLTSATSLYLKIMELTQIRLIERLEHKKNMSKQEIKDACTKFVEAMCSVCLLALRENNTLLEQKSTDYLREVCKQINMPSSELFASVLTVKMRWKLSGCEKEVSFPHKGLQDFYASLSLVSSLTNDDKINGSAASKIEKALEAVNIPSEACTAILQFTEKQIDITLHGPKTIYKLLQDLHKDDKESFQLCKYQNVLVHLSGLLKKQGTKDLLEQYAEEIVDLLKKSGTRDPEQWLNVLAEAECDPTFTKEVSKVISRERWRVRDGNLLTATMLLKHTTVHHIDINIDGDPCNLPDLVGLLQQLSNSMCNIELNLHHHWRHPKLGCTDVYFNHLRAHQHHTRLQVSKIMGSIGNMSNLFPTIEILHLGIGNEFAQNSLNTQNFLRNNATQLECLYLHVVAEVPVDALPHLPDKRLLVDLWLSDVDDKNVKWAGEAALQLQSQKIIFWSIRFPRSQLTVEGCEALATQLAGVRMGDAGVHVCSSRIAAANTQQLNPVYLKELQKPFTLTNEVKIWEL